MYIDFDKENNKESPKFKLVIILEYQNMKILLQNVMFEISLKNFCWLEKLKVLFRGLSHIISELQSSGIVGKFYEKELQKTKQKEVRIGKVVKRKGDKLYLKWKC